MADILRRIEAYKRKEIGEAKLRMPLSTLERRAHEHAPRGFVRAIDAKLGEGRLGLIAEIKKASPSQGLIRADFDPPSLAKAYQHGGAACLSVLTDTPSFQGKLDYLEAVRRVSQLPVLRKDFLFDPYQVYEARAYGADCILIIMACVSDEEAKRLNKTAHDLALDVLVEAHDEEELDRGLELETRLVGINNRDLRNFQTKLETCERLAEKIPSDRIVVAESGIATHADCLRLSRAGIRVFLVGESLMREPNVAEATRGLLYGPVSERGHLGKAQA